MELHIQRYWTPKLGKNVYSEIGIFLRCKSVFEKEGFEGLHKLATFSTAY